MVSLPVDCCQPVALVWAKSFGYTAATDIPTIACSFHHLGGVQYRKGGEFAMWRSLLNHSITCEYHDSSVCSVAAICFNASNALLINLWSGLVWIRFIIFTVWSNDSTIMGGVANSARMIVFGVEALLHIILDILTSGCSICIHMHGEAWSSYGCTIHEGRGAHGVR